MKYCVIKDTTTVIDGSENTDEIMLKNAESAGLTSVDIEILTEEEYKTRVDSLPVPIVEPTIEDRLLSMESAITALLGV